MIYNGGVKEQDLVTLTMKYNDGATADSTYNVASGTTITLPTPRRSGCTFNGWYDGSKFYAAGASYGSCHGYLECLLELHFLRQQLSTRPTPSLPPARPSTAA